MKQIQQVASMLFGLDVEAVFEHDTQGKTRFEVVDEEGEEVGKIFYGPDIFPGNSVTDPNSALSMKAACAHELSHMRRWHDKTEYPLTENPHLDEALTSLDAVLRNPTLSDHDKSSLVRDAMQRIQLHVLESKSDEPNGD